MKIMKPSSLQVILYLCLAGRTSIKMISKRDWEKEPIDEKAFSVIVM
jgi:hypothetical protein